MKIIIETIPNSEQRYPTAGDWIWTPEGNLEIKISDMKNWKYEFLVAFHELAEVMLCKDRNIPQELVDSFDQAFEKLRDSNSALIGEMEPGNMTSAPYHKEHVFATSLEKLMAKELGVDWDEYDKSVDSI